MVFRIETPAAATRRGLFANIIGFWQARQPALGDLAVFLPFRPQHDFPLAEPKWKAKSRRAGDADCSCQSQDRWHAPSRVSDSLGQSPEGR